MKMKLTLMMLQEECQYKRRIVNSFGS